MAETNVDAAGQMEDEVLDYGHDDTQQQDGDGKPDDAAAEDVDMTDGVVAAEQADAAAAEPKPEEESKPLGGSPEALLQPPHGTEVFVGGIPREATEDQIKEFFDAVGEVHAYRIPRDEGVATNRGYCFVVYKQAEDAKTAVTTLHGKSFKDFPDRKLKVIASQVKNRLFVGNLPKDMTKDQLLETMKKLVVGVEAVELMMEPYVGTAPQQNRGFGFVEFYNHMAAEAARKYLTDTQPFKLNHKSVTVLWAEPRKADQAKQDANETVRSIYVGALPQEVKEDTLKNLFSQYGEVESVAVPRLKEDASKHRGYGFVHYKERPSALAAIEGAKETKVTHNGAELTVALAKPEHSPGYVAPSARPPAGFHPPPPLGAPPPGRYSAGYGGVPVGRGVMTPSPPAPPPPGRPRPPPPPAAYPAEAYGNGYDGYEDYSEDCSGYGGYAAYGGAAYAGFGAGMGMVPMMLPNGQVGYMLAQGAATAARRPSGGGYAAAGGATAVRTGSGGYSNGSGSYGRGRGGRGSSSSSSTYVTGRRYGPY